MRAVQCTAALRVRTRSLGSCGLWSDREPSGCVQCMSAQTSQRVRERAPSFSSSDDGSFVCTRIS